MQIFKTFLSTIILWLVIIFLSNKKVKNIFSEEEKINKNITYKFVVFIYNELCRKKKIKHIFNIWF